MLYQFAGVSGKESPTDTGICGSRAGYDRHRRANEYACDACRTANTLHYAKRQGRTPTNRVSRPVAVCGTVGGYRAHYRRGEKACFQCRVAENAARQKRKLAA